MNDSSNLALARLCCLNIRVVRPARPMKVISDLLDKLCNQVRVRMRACARALTLVRGLVCSFLTSARTRALAHERACVCECVRVHTSARSMRSIAAQHIMERGRTAENAAPVRTALAFESHESVVLHALHFAHLTIF